MEPKYKPKPKPVEVVVEAPKPKPVSTDFVDALVTQSLAKRVVTILKGKVIDENTAEPLAATISLVDNETKKVLSKITVDGSNGDF